MPQELDLLLACVSMIGRVSRSAFALPGIAVTVAMLAIATAPAVGAATACHAPLRHPFPSVSSLKVSNANCGTARAVVEYVQGVWQTSNGTLQGWFRTSSHGPWWHCRYQPHTQATRRYDIARCVSGHKLVTMRLNA